MKLLNYDHKFNIKVILIIILYVLLASIINESWLYDPYGWPDHWGYFGEIFSYPKLLEIYPFHPASELLPTILPTALFYKIFQPFLANLLRDIFFLSTFLSVLFLYLKRIADTFTSLVVVFIAGGYQYLLTAIGSNYPEGSVIFFYMGALYLASIARQENKKTFLNPLFLSAIFFAFMVYSAILSVSYLPSLFLLYVLKFNDSQYSIYSVLKKRTFDFLKNYLIGFSLVTLLFSIFYYPYSHRFFYSSNIQKLFGFVSGGYTTPPFRLWLADASWLIIPSAIAISCAIYLLVQALRLKKLDKFIRSLEERHIILLINIICLIVMLFINIVIKQWSLQFLYFNQLLPVFFLGLGVLLYNPNSNLKKSKEYFGVAIVFLVSLFSLYVLNHYSLSWSDFRGYFKPHSYVAFFSAIIFTVILFILYNFHYLFRLLLLSWLLFFNIYSFSPTFGCFLCWDGFAKKNMPQPVSSSSKIFLSTIKITKFLEVIDPERTGSIWYNEKEILGPLLRQTNAVFYLNAVDHRVNKDFPSLTNYINIDAPGSDGHTPINGETLIVLSTSPKNFIEAKEALKKLKLNINKHHEYKLLLDNSIYIYATKLVLE
jgi:hypothetical protein